MIFFTNITFNDDWVYADAYDYDNRVRGLVKVHRNKSVCTVNCNKSNNFMRASWHLRKNVNLSIVKQGGECMVAWW